MGTRIVVIRNILVCAAFVSGFPCTFSSFINVFPNVTRFHYVYVNTHPVHLPCDGDTTIETVWIHNRNVINVKKLIIDMQLRKTAGLSDNYSLILKAVSLSEDGVYQCIRVGKLLARHILIVQGLYNVTLLNM